MKKYIFAPCTMSSLPPSQWGRSSLMLMPISASSKLKPRHTTRACRRTLRALSASLAPILCATCTEKPVAAALPSPQNSHVVVAMMPMLAELMAPSCPTIDASMYSMTMFEIWESMAGMARRAASSTCSRVVIPPPPERTRSSNKSVRESLFPAFSMIFVLQSYE